MTKKRLHRVSVLLLDPSRRRVLLHKYEMGPFKDQYNLLSGDFRPDETPLESVRRLVREAASVELVLLSHNTCLPEVMDVRSVRMQAPLYVQLTCVDDRLDFVDHVYLAIALTAPEFEKGGSLCWFKSEDLVGRQVPKHIKRTVRSAIELVNR